MSEVQLPEGWVWKKLGEVCILKNGFAFKSDDYTELGIPVLRISDISQGLVSIKKAVRIKPEPDFNRFLVNDGDILLAMSGATTGKFGIYRSSEPAYQNQRVGNFVVTDVSRLLKSFLFYFLTNLKRKIEEDAYGGAQPNISSKKVEEYLIPLPPLPVQQAIVAKIEELFSELDAGVKELQTALARLKTYRQAVLHHYLNNPDWERVKIGEIIKTINNGYTPKADKMTDGSGEIQFLKVYNLTFDGKLNYQKNPVFISYDTQQKELKRSITYPNDVLVNIVGPPLGKVSLVPPVADQFNINQAVVLFRPNERVLPQFLSYYLQSPKTIQWLEATSKATAGQYNVKVSTCREIPFPLVNLETQTQIVSEIEARLSEADAMEATIRQELARAENLRQSILKQAFAGKLVTATFEETSIEELAEVSEPIGPVYGGQKAGQVGEQLSLF